MTQDQVHAQPQAVSVSNEGLSPQVAAPLYPVPLPTGRLRQPPVIRRAVVDRRKTSDTAGKNLSWADLSSVATISSAPYAVRLLIQYWCDKDPNSHELQNLGVFVTSAKEALDRPPPKFVESMISSLDELKEFENSLTKGKIVPSQELRASLNRRRVKFVEDADSKSGFRKPQVEKAIEASDTKYRKPADTNKRPPFPYKDGKNIAVDELRKAEMLRGVITDIVGTPHTLCPSCGKFTDSRNIQVDHQQAITEIIANLDQVAQAISSNPQLAAKYKKEMPRFNKLFLATDKKTYQVSKGAVWDYSNDVQNLIDLCSVCNRNKSDKKLIEWYRDSTFFGEKFLDRYLDANEPHQIIQETSSGTGWAVAAREWFKEQHLPILKRQVVGIAAQEIFTNNLKEQSLQNQRLLTAQNTPERQKLEGSFEQTTIVTSLMETHHAGFLKKFPPNKAPEKFSVLSPAKYGQALDKVNRDLRADRLRRNDDDIQYKAGVKDGYLGSPQTLVKGWAHEQIESYEIGHADGAAKAEAEKEAGTRDALAADLSATPKPKDDTKYYLAAFNGILDKRRDARKAGVEDAELGKPVDAAYALGDLPELLRDYVTGYSSVQVRSAATSSAVSSTADKDKKTVDKKKVKSSK